MAVCSSYNVYIVLVLVQTFGQTRSVRAAGMRMDFE